MRGLPRNVWEVLRRREPAPQGPAAPAGPAPAVETVPVEIAPNDPLVAYFQSASGPVDLAQLDLTSPGLDSLRGAGVRMVVPLVSQGELIGLLNLGPRRSEQDYSTDDRRLLADLAGHAAPAVRLAQLVREQQAEIRERERVEQELAVAQLIQQQFLPRQLPDLPGWQVAAHYQPARAVGGDFYDFIELPGGEVAIVVGDVTDKGVPAALVMATTHSILRAEAPRLVAPAEVLERVNNLLVDEMPAHMFVTCLYAVLDPTAGTLRYANAGHNLPYVRSDGGVAELRATGMPLGLMPGMDYEEKQATLAPGDELLLHSDGLAEAHGPRREMFGFPRIAKLMGEGASGQELLDLLLAELARFTGSGWAQEDDITLVTLRRSGPAAAGRLLADFEIASEPGNERLAIARVVEAVEDLELPAGHLERLKTAVGEAAMNAIEHGNGGRADLPVGVQVTATPAAVTVRVTDRGGRPIPKAELPDLEAKLAGLQEPRGWGLFLIENMVDEVRTSTDEGHHAVELVVRLDTGDGRG